MYQRPPQTATATTSTAAAKIKAKIKAQNLREEKVRKSLKQIGTGKNILKKTSMA